jgi:hypothetical protein
MNGGDRRPVDMARMKRALISSRVATPMVTVVMSWPSSLAVGRECATGICEFKLLEIDNGNRVLAVGPAPTLADLAKQELHGWRGRGSFAPPPTMKLLFRPELKSQSSRIQVFVISVCLVFRPELKSQSSRILARATGRIGRCSSGQSSNPNRLESVPPPVQAGASSGQSSNPNRLECAFSSRNLALSSGQSSNPNRLESGGSAAMMAMKFRPELKSQSSRMSLCNISAIWSTFRPELKSQSSRITLFATKVEVKFRPELKSQSSRISVGVVVWPSGVPARAQIPIV